MGDPAFTEMFLLTLFGEMENVKYAYFVLVLLIYLSIISINLTLILVILLERNLHEPMYVFLCGLSVNSLYGTAGFFPRFLADLLSDTHTITRAACFTQAFIIYSYAGAEFTFITVMAYDRYVAICKPLQYNSIMGPRTVLILVMAALLYPLSYMVVAVSCSARKAFCGHEINRLYCANWSLIRLSCDANALKDVFGICFTAFTVFLPCCFILYSYIRILLICQKRSSEFKSKALKTCLPHLLTFVNYSITIISEIILIRLDSVPRAVAVILSLEFLIIPPILNPLMYGLNLPEIRRRIIFIRKNKMRMNVTL
uniref:Olfactory receptor n=2 Tax=Lepisosteus oculatus TaxID=7918 RepID=W5NLQ0_LEPOC